MFKKVCMNSHESGYVQCKNDSENLMYCYAGLYVSVYIKKIVFMITDKPQASVILTNVKTIEMYIQDY